jgi:quinol monooxygenase YgiN
MSPQNLSPSVGPRLALTHVMVQVTLTMVSHPRRRAEMIQALRSLMLPLQAAQGFISCHLCQETEDANTIFYAEEWHTPEDLDRQIRSSHYTRLLAIMEEAAQPPELRLNWVAEVRGLEYLEAVRLCDR